MHTLILLALFGAAVLLFLLIWIIEEWLHASPLPRPGRTARELVSFAFFWLCILAVPFGFWLLGKLIKP